MSISLQDRVLGGLWGSIVGDALGVPVEFLSREALRKKPVSAMVGFGTHHQPPGTWSDDSSLLLCSVESLLTGFNTTDMAKRFVAWVEQGHWTPWGQVFDIGGATRDALNLIAKGTPAEQAGGDSVHSNGNGSLMRMLPIALRFHASNPEELIDIAHRVSAITHRHVRSLMACGFYCLVVRELMNGTGIHQAYQSSVVQFLEVYKKQPFINSLSHFELIVNGDLASRREHEISSSGYVIDTLTASLWTLLNTSTFEHAVLTAVNLGGDSDTTGCVTGGLAGVYYGQSSIPSIWRSALARVDDLNGLLSRFVCDFVEN